MGGPGSGRRIEARDLRKRCGCGRWGRRTHGHISKRTGERRIYYESECEWCYRRRTGRPIGRARFQKDWWTAVDRSRCERCGFVPEHPCQIDVDHITPKALGGTNERDNLMALCANCHRLKSQGDVSLFRARFPGDERQLGIFSDARA